MTNTESRKKREVRWTEAALRAQGPMMDGVDGAMAWGDCSINTAYKLLNNGELPFPVYRIGRRFKVRTADVLRALGLESELPAA